LPKTNEPLPKESIQKFYQEAQSISIDYGILEHSDKVLVIESDFEWSDLGAPEALNRILEKKKV